MHFTFQLRDVRIIIRFDVRPRTWSNIKTNCIALFLSSRARQAFKKDPPPPHKITVTSLPQSFHLQ